MPRHSFRRAGLGLCLALAGLADRAAFGQAFQNLNFEQSVIATQSGISHATVPAWRFSDELPIYPLPGSSLGTPYGWTNQLGVRAHIGDIPLQRATTDLTPPGGGYLPPPIEGHFSIVMRGAVDSFDPQSFPWMEQTGVVPPLAKSIRLTSVRDVESATSAGWTLTMNGVAIPAVQLPDGRFSGDVSALAGTSQTLRVAINGAYAVPLGFGSFARPTYAYDAFHFSPLPFNEAPEPGSATLLLLGMARLRRRTIAWPAVLEDGSLAKAQRHKGRREGGRRLDARSWMLDEGR